MQLDYVAENGGPCSIRVWIKDTTFEEAKKEIHVKMVHTDRGSEATSYITSIAGQRFKVCFQVDGAETDLSAHVYIDGQWAGGALMGVAGTKSTGIRSLDSIDAGPGQIYPFRFGRMQASGITFAMRLMVR
jgi:hypothetical protein